MDASEAALSLVQQALDDLERPDVRLSTVMRRALRVARIRSDFEAVYWIQRELEPLIDPDAKIRAAQEIAHHYTKAEWKELNRRQIEHSISTRQVFQAGDEPDGDKDKVTVHSVPQMEAILVGLEAEDTTPLHSNLHPLDAYHFTERRNASRAEGKNAALPLRLVLARIAHRVHTYLSQVERDILHGQSQSDIFEQNRQYVDEKLSQIAPEVRVQLQSAYRRVREGDSEARSQALTSCRRVLKSLADRLYPARVTPVRGTDGKERVLTDAMFVARLWQFIGESHANSTSSKLLIADVTELGTRIDRLNDLASKGVHDQVSEFEVNTCVLSTYTAVGALLRLHDQQSGALLTPSELSTER